MSFINKSKHAGTKRLASQEQINIAQAGFELVGGMTELGQLKNNSDLGRSMVSSESFSNQAEESAAGNMLNALTASVESFAMRTGGKFGSHSATPQQKEAVAFALASAMNPRAHITRAGNTTKYATTSPMSIYVPDHTGVDPSKLGKATLEAYDTKPNDETLNFTAAFALATATQNKFAELFYKTVNLAPDQYAIEMEIPIISVHEQVRYELERKLTNFNKQNIVNAEIDSTILKNDTLKITPIVRAQTVDAFTPAAIVAPRSVILESGESVMTAPLRPRYRSSLFRLAQTDAQMAKGLLDQTDALDPGAVLTGVWMQFANADASVKEVIRFDVSNSPLNQFVEALQGLTRTMNLAFTTDTAVLDANTKQANGADSVLLAAFQGPTAHTGWLSFSVRGDINLQDSSYELLDGTPAVRVVRNADKSITDLDAAPNAALKALLATATIVGLDIDVRKVNSNLRELGQLADFNTYRQVYGVSLGSPLSVQRPITNGDSQDALHAAALSYMCKARQSNLAVTQLLSEVETLRQFRKASNIVDRQPAIMGISSYLLDPVLEEITVDLLQEVTTTSQHQRYADIRSILTDTCRIAAYKIWQLSNWQAAANLLEGTEAQYPEVKLGTDLVLLQYLMVEGDTRTMGADFTFEKASSPDIRVRDKIFIALGYKSGNPGVPHPLDHGMMITKPEVVAALNLSRSSHSRELIVHPSFRHIPLCPVLAVVTVLNLQEALTQKATLQVEVANAAEFPV